MKSKEKYENTVSKEEYQNNNLNKHCSLYLVTLTLFLMSLFNVGQYFGHGICVKLQNILSIQRYEMQ